MFQARYAEIKFAAARLKEFDWVDQNNLYLVGQSEGGMTVGAYQGDEYRGRVISGDDCEEGLYDPENTMVIASTGGDKWVEDGGFACRMTRPKKLTLVDGAAHFTFVYPEANRDVMRFLKEMLSQ